MTIYVGGRRVRLIRDSLYYMVNQALTDLGWFNPVRAHEPLTVINEPVSRETQITPNTLVLTEDLDTTFGIEMGSDFSEFRMVMYADFYAESEVLTVELNHDIRDILQGRLTSIGRSRPILPVYDYSLATPSFLFNVDIEDVIYDRPNAFTQPWLKYWSTVRFDLVDHYWTDADA